MKSAGTLAANVHRILIVLAMLAAGRCPAGQDRIILQYPRVDDRAYGYFDRAETMGLLPLLSQTQPYLGHKRHPVALSERIQRSREDVRFHTESAANLAAVSRLPEPALAGGWRSVRRAAGLPEAALPWLYADGFHFASWNYDTSFSAAIQPVYGLTRIATDDERGTISRFTGGLRIEGGYAQRVHFMMDFRDHTESGNGPYWSRDQLYEDRWGAVDFKGGASTSYNISESFLQFYGRDLSLAAGRGRFRWGPARFGSLFLDSRNPPFDYVRFDAVLEPAHGARAVYYTFLHGWLQSRIAADTLYFNPDGRPRTLNAEKYLSAQRLEIRPRGNLLLGLSQGVVYGDRGVQPGYLTPLSFLYSVQHSNDDKDNFVLALDGTWRAARGLRLYGELFFDDIVVGELTTSSGSNKSAFTAGMHVVPPHRFGRHFDLGLEYTKIRPFVYTHFFATNVYSHWYSPLGYTREPNSEFITAELRGTFYPVTLAAKFSRQNHGANYTADGVYYNVGGDIDQANYGAAGATYRFLAGRFERTTRIGLRAEWEPLPAFVLFAELAAISRSRQANRTETFIGFGWNL